MCNGTSGQKPLLPDPQLFEAQFEELVSELTEEDISDPALADASSRLREVCPPSSCSLVPGGFERLLKAFASVLSGADVQRSWREEKPRAFCDWFPERACPVLGALAGRGAARPVGWMVHRTSKKCTVLHHLCLFFSDL